MANYPSRWQPRLPLLEDAAASATRARGRLNPAPIPLARSFRETPIQVSYVSHDPQGNGRNPRRGVTHSAKDQQARCIKGRLRLGCTARGPNKAPPERGSGAKFTGQQNWGLPALRVGRMWRQTHQLNAEPHHRLHSAGETRPRRPAVARRHLRSRGPEPLKQTVTQHGCIPSRGGFSFRPHGAQKKPRRSGAKLCRGSLPPTFRAPPRHEGQSRRRAPEIGGKPRTERRADPLVSMSEIRHGAHRKSPAKGAGAQVGFIVSRLPQRARRPGGASVTGKMTRALALGGATDETLSRAVGFCVGRPTPRGTKKPRQVAGLSRP